MPLGSGRWGGGGRRPRSHLGEEGAGGHRGRGDGQRWGPCRERAGGCEEGSGMGPLCPPPGGCFPGTKPRPQLGSGRFSPGTGGPGKSRHGAVAAGAGSVPAGPKSCPGPAAGLSWGSLCFGAGSGPFCKGCATGSGQDPAQNRGTPGAHKAALGFLGRSGPSPPAPRSPRPLSVLVLEPHGGAPRGPPCCQPHPPALKHRNPRLL